MILGERCGLGPTCGRFSREAIPAIALFMAVRRLERLDIGKSVSNMAAELDVRRPNLLPAPPLKRAVAHAPAPRHVGNRCELLTSRRVLNC